MKVLHVSHRHFIAGGSDAVFFQTARLLEEAGHDVVPFCIRDDRNEPSDYAEYFPGAADTGSPRMRDMLRYFWNGEAARNLVRLIRDHGPFDVAHLHIYHGKQTPAILRVLRRAGIPIVQTLHEYKLACPVYTLEHRGRPCQACVTGSSLHAMTGLCKDGSLTRSAVMWAEYQASRWLGDVAYVDRFICVSHFQRAIMERAGIPAEKLATLHNCVDPAARPGPGTGGLLYFGRIEELKGLSTLLQAIRATGQELTIAGAGSWDAELRKRIAGIETIRHVGFQSGAAMTDLIRNASAVLVPSEWYENCPMTILEAKAQGVPVIGAAIGGIPELVRDGIDGFLFTPGDPEDLAQAIGAFERADRAKLAKHAIEDIRARFSPTVHRMMLLSHYRSAMVARRVGAATLLPAGIRPQVRQTDLRT